MVLLIVKTRYPCDGRFLDLHEYVGSIAWDAFLGPSTSPQDVAISAV